MKVRVKGKNPRINLSICSSSSLRNELRKLEERISELLVEQTNDLTNQIETLIQEGLQNELYSERFEEFLRSIYQEDPGADRLREIAEQLLNEDAEVVTTAGTVSGTITEVGTDYMILRETDATILVIPFQNTISIRPL